MNSNGHNAAHPMCQAISRQAEHEAESIRSEAASARVALLAKTRAEAEREAATIVDAARKLAARQRQNTLAMVPVEVARLRSLRQEEILAAVRAGASDALQRRDHPRSGEELVALIMSAIHGMSGKQFVVEISASDLTDHGATIRAAAAEQGIAVELCARADVHSGACVRDAEGRQTWDNRLASRLARLWPQLRGQVIEFLHVEAGEKP